MRYAIWLDDGDACRWYAGGGRTAPRLAETMAEAYPLRHPAPVVGALKLLHPDALVVAQVHYGKPRASRAA